MEDRDGDAGKGGAGVRGGGSPDDIRAYIRNAWANWPVPPEYIVIAGGPGHIGFPGSSYDCRYGDVTGDYRVELPVGRLYARDLRECSTTVSKTLAYERPDVTGDTMWFLKGCTIVREDGDPDDSVYWSDSRICHGYWQAGGYTRIDSMSKVRGHDSIDVVAAGNDGRAFIVYRGQCGGHWWPPFGGLDPFSWTNGSMLPIVLGITCASINVETNWSWTGDEFMRAGSPDMLGGAVAYFGATLIGGGVSAHRSACLRGFMEPSMPRMSTGWAG